MGCEVTSETCGDADRRSEKYEIEMVQSCAVSLSVETKDDFSPTTTNCHPSKGNQQY